MGQVKFLTNFGGQEVEVEAEADNDPLKSKGDLSKAHLKGGVKGDNNWSIGLIRPILNA